MRKIIIKFKDRMITSNICVFIIDPSGESAGCYWNSQVSGDLIIYAIKSISAVGIAETVGGKDSTID